MSKLPIMFTLGVLFAGPASAEEGFLFKVENDLSGTMTVSVDGTTKCTLEAGKRCEILLAEETGHAYSYSLAGGAPIAFDPGNLEATDLCRIGANGTRCTDPDGKPTN